MKSLLKNFLKLIWINKAIIFLVLPISYIHSQSNLIVSNQIKGKVIGLGFNHGFNGNNFSAEKEFYFNCTECESIGKAYIIAYEINVSDTINSDLTPFNFLINNNTVVFDENTRIGDSKTILNGWAINHFKPINLSCSSLNKINFKISPQPIFHHITGFYILFECLNSTYDQINYELIVNTFSNNPNLNIIYGNPISINPINLFYDVGYSVVSLVLNFMNGDANNITFNGNFIGKIAGADLSSSDYYSSGTRGHFEYKNGILFGLDDDTPDFIMDSTDALANVRNLITNNSSVFFSSLPEEINNQSNNTQAVILTYSSNCLENNYFTTSDTTICANLPLQLSASGGVQYEWNTSTGSASDVLSCTTCPNPIFTGDSSRVFTVQIWNNDSCSVVRPVSIRVKDNPEIKSLSISPTLCGLETGALTIVGQNTAVLPLQFALDNNPYVFSSTYTKSFSALDSGFVTVHLKDGNGCVTDSVVFVGVSNPTQALFSANPSTGAAPLNVNLTNSSVFATNYEWFLNEEQQNSNFSNFLADTSGVYEIELIAWQNDPKCADTFALTIDVYDSLMLQMPNIFSPNNDAVNDIFGISANIPISMKYLILNRWGNVVFEGNSKSSQLAKFVSIWDGTSTGAATASEGVYFYQLEIDLIEKNDKMKLDFPIKKEGFLQLVR